MPLKLATSGNFHIVAWVGAATLQEAQRLSEDVKRFHQQQPRSSPIHGVCVLQDETRPPETQARKFMDEETNALLERLNTVHYVLDVQSGFRRAALQAVLAGAFLMRGVGGRILCHKDKAAFRQYVTAHNLVQSTTPILLLNALEQAEREALKDFLPKK